MFIKYICNNVTLGMENSQNRSHVTIIIYLVTFDLYHNASPSWAPILEP